MDTNVMSVKSDGKTRISKANTELNSKLVAMSSSWVKTTTHVADPGRPEKTGATTQRLEAIMRDYGNRQPVNYLRGIAHNLRF